MFEKLSLFTKRRSPKFYVWAGIIVLLALLPLFLGTPYVLHLLILTFIYIIVSVSLRTITISGQFPLAHGAFMGIGAYASGVATKSFGLTPALSIIIAVIFTTAIGMLIGYLFSRLRTLYYAIGSLFFGIGVIYIVYSTSIWTGGQSGLSGIPPLIPNATSKIPYYYFFLVLCLISIIALYRFEFSRIGKILKAIAQSHLVASSVGINEQWYRILVVGVGCFFAGLAGACYAHYNMVISPSAFNFMATLWLVMYVLIGGIHSFAGPIVGTAILFLFTQSVRDLQEFTPYVSAALLLIVLFLMPQGLVSLPSLLKSLYLKIRKMENVTDVSRS